MIRLERVYEIVTDGAPEQLVLRFSDEPTPDDMSEHCVRLEIEGPGESWTTRIYGMDEIQALLFAMRIARARLESSKAFVEGRLRVRHWGSVGEAHLPVESRSSISKEE
jgi:hypothetical protein